MKWYNYIIERFQDYKWYLFTPFAFSFLIGAVEFIVGHTPNIGGLTFVGLLILWAIFWIIASIFYKINYKL